MLLDQSKNWGYFSMFLCCITNAVSFVFIAHINKSHNEMLSLAMISGYAILLFNGINFKSLDQLYQKVRKNICLFSLMNFLTFINWLSGFSSLSYLDPATVMCIELAISAVVTFLIMTPLKQFLANKHLVLCIVLILFCMTLIIGQHIAITSNLSNSHLALGFFWCFLGGLSAAYIGIYSVRMDIAKFSVTEILATRFYLLAIFGFAMIFFSSSHTEILQQIDWKYYFLASLIVVFFPLIMYQVSVKAIGPLQVSLLEPFTPVIAFFLQIATGSYSFNLITLSLLILSCVGVIWLVKTEQNLTTKKMH
jgi:drug/metabolite transporter (DMT)-like permease